MPLGAFYIAVLLRMGFETEIKWTNKKMTNGLNKIKNLVTC